MRRGNDEQQNRSRQEFEFRCRPCDQEFQSRVEFEQHERNFHAEVEEEEEIWSSPQR